MNTLNDLESNASDFVPIRNLSYAYDAANDLNEEGLEGLCPSYSELKKSDVRYSEKSFLGEGALKEVYKAFDSKTQRWVALAMLRRDRGPDYFDCFVNESWLIASLQHPNIIKVFDAGIDDTDRPYFTMDLKGNTTLSDLRKQRPMNRENLWLLLEGFIKICDAIAYAHSRGVVHLDLKPDNIQCEAFGEVLVCDWGLAKSCNDDWIEETSASTIKHSLDNTTLVGQIKGSLGYMAPEQLDGSLKKDAYTDVYALGCMLHFILTGEPPFTGTPDQVIAATRESKVVSPRLRFPLLNIPESLEAVVLKATCFSPAERYQSIADLRSEIQNYLAGFSTQAEDSGLLRELKLFLVRHRLPTSIITSAIIVIGILSFFFFRHLDHQRSETEHERDRAETLGSDLDQLYQKHESLFSTASESKSRYAEELSFAAKRVKNEGIFVRPIETIEQARKMALLSTEFDSEFSPAHNELFSLNCLELNYKAAVAHPPENDPGQLDNFTLAKAFPEFAFSKDHRPSIPEFIDFLQKARLINDRCGDHLERIISFDHATRNSTQDYDQVVEAYLQYLHGGSAHLSLHYDPDTKEAYLWSDVPLKLQGQSSLSLLRFLAIRSLRIQSPDALELDGLDGLHLESIDLRGSNQVIYPKKTIRLPNLQHLYVRSGQVSPSQLSRKIRTSGDLQIVGD